MIKFEEEDVNRFVEGKDYVGLVRAYLNAIDSGNMLPLPKGLSFDECKENWDHILSKYQPGIAAEFIDELADYWSTLISRQGGVVTEYFAKEMINIIDNKPKSATSRMDNLPEGFVYGQHDPKEETKYVEKPPSTISKTYDATVKAREKPELSRKQNRSKIIESIKNGDVKLFCLYYLSQIRYGSKVELPLSTLPGLICKRWEAILMEHFSVKPAKVFINELTTLWVELVNKKGLPASPIQIQELLIFYSSTVELDNNDGIDPVPIQENRGLFGKISDLIKRLF